MINTSDSIRRGLSEALAYAEGRGDPNAFRVHPPRDVNVKALRMRLAMTQQEFASTFGFSVHALRRWEQGRSRPEGPARAYLLVIDRAPQVVRDALRAA